MSNQKTKSLQEIIQLLTTDYGEAKFGKYYCDLGDTNKSPKTPTLLQKIKQLRIYVSQSNNDIY